MFKNNILVKHLPTVENMGCVDVIASDKTVRLPSRDRQYLLTQINVGHIDSKQNVGRACFVQRRNVHAER